MSEDNSNANALRPIVVKRIKKIVAGGHHGGAWKIAYADFVTAMMAFFLLMWLLGSTSQGDLNGIAEYFQTPLKVALAGGSGSGDSSSILKGGGTDITRSVGQVRNGSEKIKKSTVDIGASKKITAQKDGARLNALKKKFEALINGTGALSKYKKQLLLDITPEGLRIQIVDDKKRPMFALAEAELQPYAKEILQVIGSVLNDVPDMIGLSGHTDSAAYQSKKNYSNWELSSDRANASRRELIRGGMAEKKVLRVIGLGSAVNLDQTDPSSPLNRRISITVMNTETADTIRHEPIGNTMDVATQ